MSLRAVRPRRPRELLDLLGLGLSGLCLVHCVTLPILLVALPAVAGLGHDAHHHSLHLVLALVLVPLAVVSLVPGCLRHRRAPVVMAGALGVVAILCGAFLEVRLGEALATGHTIAGSLCLARPGLTDHELSGPVVRPGG